MEEKTFFLEKSTLNGLRKALQYSSTTNRKVIESLTANRDYIDSLAFRVEYSSDRVAAISRVEEACYVSLPLDASKKEIKEALGKRIEYKRLLEKKLQTVIGALTKFGLNKVTQGLPMIPFVLTDKDVSVSFMMITGIKKNALLKKEEDACDELERKLISYEQKLAAYIDDNFLIARSDIVPFITLYKEYLELYYFGEPILAELIYYREKLDLLMSTMGLYIVYCNIDCDIEEDECVALKNLYRAYLNTGLVTEGEAVELMCDRVFYEFEKSKMKKMQKPEVERDPIDEYIENGHVVKLLELDQFRGLLDNSRLNDKLKVKYLGEMEALLEEEKQNNYRRAFKKSLSSVMDEQELELYNLGRCYVDAKRTIENIDAGVEMLLETENVEDREILMGELDSKIGELKRFFAPAYGTEPTVDGLVYYTCDILDTEGKDVKIPLLLRSILSDKMLNRFAVDKMLRDIMDGNTLRDRKIKGTDLPCTVWVKGRDEKIFYTKVGNTTVVIDLGYGDDVYSYAEWLVTSEDFKQFLETLEEHIKRGNKPNAEGYTDLIKTSLNRHDKIIKLV